MMIEINERQIKKVAKILKEMPEGGKGLNFYNFTKDGKEIVASDMYPALNHPQALNFFFFVVMHDYGFWYGDDKGYHKPLYGNIGGRKVKGSDLLWMASRRALDNKAKSFFTPERLADISPEMLTAPIFFGDKAVFSDDDGPIVWPDFGTRFAMTRAYGCWFIDNKTSPNEIVILANQAEEPLKEFLWQTRQIPGYNRDYIEKKNLLLAMALANRPEKFLNVKDPENWKPLVDYHVMRLFLRLGMIDLGREEKEKNKKREWVSYETHQKIRYAAFKATCELIKESGRTMSFIDEKLWTARKYCPEMEKPDCPKCDFVSACKKRVELFQPVFRTTAY